MANTVYQVKRTSVASRQPNTTSAGNLQYIPAGGLALNMTDQILYSSDGTNLIYVGSNQFNLSVTNILTTKAISANGSNGTAGQVLYSNGTSTYWNDPAGGPGGSPGGSNTWVQFNDSTAFGATAGFTFDKDTNNATIANNLLVGVGVNSAAFTVGTATVANSLGVYTGVVNGTSITVGTDVVSNSTGVFATGTVNAASHTVGTSTVANSTGVYTGIVNGSTLSVGTAFTANSTLVNAIGYSISTTFIANTLGLYHTGTVNAASLSVGTATVANATGLYTTGTVNAASHTVGTSFTANSTVVNAVAYNISTSFVANTLGLYHTGAVNAASLTVGTATVSNSTGVFTTGTVNAASHTIGTSFTANSTLVNATAYAIATTFVANSLGLYHTGTVNAASHTVGTSTVANSTGVYTGVVNGSTLSVGTAFTVNSTLMNVHLLQFYANGSLGSGGQVLTSNGATGGVYWSTPTGAPGPTGPKALTVLSPVAGDAFTLFWSNSAITVAEIRTVVVGTGSPTVNASFFHGTDRSSGTAMQTNIQTTNTTLGNSQTSFANATPAVNSYIWCVINQVSGTVTEYHATVRF